MNPKPVRLLPHEQLLMKIFGAKVERNKRRSNAAFEASHGARGRELLTVGSIEISAVGMCWLVYLLISTHYGNFDLWPGYVVFIVFFVIGGFRMVQATKSPPDSDPNITEEK
jgi:hypothetical protein